MAQPLHFATSVILYRHLVAIIYSLWYSQLSQFPNEQLKWIAVRT